MSLKRIFLKTKLTYKIYLYYNLYLRHKGFLKRKGYSQWGEDKIIGEFFKNVKSFNIKIISDNKKESGINLGAIPNKFSIEYLK